MWPVYILTFNRKHLERGSSQKSLTQHQKDLPPPSYPPPPAPSAPPARPPLSYISYSHTTNHQLEDEKISGDSSGVYEEISDNIYACIDVVADCYQVTPLPGYYASTENIKRSENEYKTLKDSKAGDSYVINENEMTNNDVDIGKSGNLNCATDVEHSSSFPAITDVSVALHSLKQTDESASVLQSTK